MHAMPPSRTIAASAALIAVLCFAGASAATQTQAPDAAAFQGEPLEQFLAKARMVRMRDAGSGVTAPQRVTLERDGVTRDAVFKIIDEYRPGVSQIGQVREVEFQDSWQTEIPAYVIDRWLGLGMVPATVERTINGHTGSLQLWVTSMASEEGRRTKGLTPPDQEAFNRLMLKMQLFDQLICNVDRHLNNVLITENFELRLIDHSRAFRPLNELRDPSLLPRFSRSLLDALPRLERQALKKRVGMYLRDSQITALLKRRDAILALAKQRIAEHGEAAVIYP